MRNLARIFLLMIMLLLYGCKAVRYVPVEITRIDTTQIIKVKVDSIYQRDSIYVEHKGDTVYKYKYKYINKYIQRVDTFWRTRIDTIQVPYPVKAELTKWQKFKANIGWYLVAFLTVLFIISLFKLKR